VRRVLHLLPLMPEKSSKTSGATWGYWKREVLDVGLDDTAVINRQVFRHLHKSASQAEPFIVFFVKICFPVRRV